MASHVDTLIAEIRALSSEERQTVIAAVTETSREPSEQTPLAEQSADEAYQRRLLAAGLISEIRLRHRDQEEFDRFTPVPITGPPLSQTIIEERR
jgi:hypothetical protein